MIEFCCAVAVICCLIAVCILNKHVDDLTKVVEKLIEQNQSNERLWGNQLAINKGVLNALELIDCTEEKKDES